MVIEKDEKKELCLLTISEKMGKALDEKIGSVKKQTGYVVTRQDVIRAKLNKALGLEKGE